MTLQHSSRAPHTNALLLIQPLDGPCFSTGRSAFRTSVSACRSQDGCLQYGLVYYMQRAGSLGVLDRAVIALEHQLPRVAGSATSLAASPAAAWLACVGPQGQHCGCLVHQPAGLPTITSHATTRPPSPPLESGLMQVAELPSTSWGSLIMQPTCSHDSSHSLENNDSIPRQSSYSGVDSGKLR